jgi:hypothetical protein
MVFSKRSKIQKKDISLKGRKEGSLQKKAKWKGQLYTVSNSEKRGGKHSFCRRRHTSFHDPESGG